MAGGPRLSYTSSKHSTCQTFIATQLFLKWEITAKNSNRTTIQSCILLVKFLFYVQSSIYVQAMDSHWGCWDGHTHFKLQVVAEILLCYNIHFISALGKAPGSQKSGGKE